MPMVSQLTSQLYIKIKFKNAVIDSLSVKIMWRIERKKILLTIVDDVSSIL